MKETLGRYKIIKEIGRGAMGTVYQGYDPKIDRIVALKTIRKDRLAESKDVEDLVMRFQKEVRATGKLVHPNIIVVYDTGEDEETAYIAMEYIEGDTLENLLQKGIPFSLEKIIDIVDQICDGLEYTHRHGIVHRDLKPSNIMLVKGGRVKITDFGISKAVGASSSPLTQAGVFLGTPSYMSPEQIVGSKINGRSDLFSLGIILYQLLTGEKPFAGYTISTLLYNIVNKDPKPPSQIDSGLPLHFDEVLARALAKDPDKRYHTAKEFLEDLKRVYRGEAAVEVSDIETTMTAAEGIREKFYPERKRYGLLAGLGALLLFMVLGSFYWMHYRMPKPPEGEGVSEVTVKKRVAIPVEKDAARPILSPAEEGKKAETMRAFGSIVVKSTPPGALVSVDGKMLEAPTPTVIEEVTVGEKHELKVEKEGFKPWTQTVELKPDKPLTVEASLTEGVREPSLTGEIRISSAPRGAEVFLNGEYMGCDTPTLLSGLSPGKYQLRLKKEGYEVWEGEVTVGASESLDLSGVKLQEAFGKLNLHVSPWADVYYRGEKLGTTPLANIQLQEGIHKLVLKNPLLNIEKGVTVRIVANELTKKSVNLTEGIKGKLKVRVTPWAHVYVDGNPMGMTPLKPLELTVGEHIILVKNDKLGRQRSSRIIIKPNEVYSMVVDLLKKE
jgi:tRNA A-37 threonylcarbamoyl transferase component Bud32